MQKIMYLCPVDWRWIKQRPQFLAEELSLYFDMHVLYPYKNNRRGLQKGVHTQVRLTPWITLPTLGGKLRFIGKVNAVLSKLQMAIAMKKIKPDILWVSMPWQIDFFSESVSCQIVYDCMDDYAAISADRVGVKELMAQEKRLIERADVIFASSENLRHVLESRYRIEKDRIQLLRNGYNADRKSVV